MDTVKAQTSRRSAAATAVVLFGATFVGGCAYQAEPRIAPAASPPTTTTVVVTSPVSQRVVNYSTGRYELYGDGISTPYYWVWIPAGTMIPAPPPPPSIPR
jgi:hypothetical protein